MADACISLKRERRATADVDFNFNSIKAILLDIEGTTTPIKFVKEVLFPYARTHLKEYVETNWENEKVEKLLKSLREESNNEEKNDSKQNSPVIISKSDDKDCFINQVVTYVNWLMDCDRKSTTLKTLQGMIWSDAYKQGAIKGEIFQDVRSSMKTWKTENKMVYIYSSGSVAAQKLLFGYCENGSVLDLIDGHYDTEIGSKLKSESYVKIAKDIKCETREILFLTDSFNEGIAANEANINVVLCDRPGNAPLTKEQSNQFKVVLSFDDLYKDDEQEPDSKKTNKEDEN